MSCNWLQPCFGKSGDLLDVTQLESSVDIVFVMADFSPMRSLKLNKSELILKDA